MGLFSNADKAAPGKRGTTIIAEGSRIEGELTLSVNLHVDGEVNGIVRSEADVSVGCSGHLQGDICARRVVVNGELSGKVDCDLLEIVTGGKVFGEVILQELIIESGGLFEGQSRRRNQDSVTALSHDVKKHPALPAVEATAIKTIEKAESKSGTVENGGLTQSSR